MYRIGLDGARPTQVTTRYLGSTTAIGRDAVLLRSAGDPAQCRRLQRPL
jgi:hypothetical protein